MNRSYQVVFAYVFFVFLLLALVTVWPKEGSPMLVVLAPIESGPSADKAFYRIISGTEARLIDKLSSHRFVVAGADDRLVRKLYENGAFLVLRANPNIGCETPPEAIDSSPFYKV